MQFIAMNLLHVFLFAWCLFHLATPIRAQGPLYPAFCNTAFNYTPSSPFARNLNLTLRSLIANASLNGFYSTTMGSSPDRVYGLLQCRGDVSPQDCGICGNASSSELQKSCQYQTEAVVYYDNCWLRYASYRFFTSASNDPELYTWNLNNISDPNLFGKKVGDLMNNLSSAAASNAMKFSTGVTNFMGSDNVYGMVQCTRDIDESSCWSCLQRMISNIPACCGGKQGGAVYSKSCNVRFGTYSFFQSSPSPTPPEEESPPPIQMERNSPNERANQKGPKSSLRNIVPTVIAAAVALAVISAICTYLRWKKGRKKRSSDVEEERTRNTESLIFDLSTVKAATRDFCDSYKLGQGGFGPVYKGTLFDGRQVAVKRLSQTSGQGLEELKTEVVLVAKLQHKNLVRLLGFCLQKEEKLLVYEYLSNGSLDQVLFDESKRLLLDWDKRYRIIVGIAQGLLYLHRDSQIRIIHRDLKASNILLDEDMNPKISDFGLARLLPGSQTQANTIRIAGTYGYIAPEYAKNGHFSTKSDVFSFGVLILEIVTGKKNSSFRDSGNLQSYTWRHWTNGTTFEMMDETIDNQWLRSEAQKCIHIGLLCVQHDAFDRPTMSEVILMLNSYTFTCPVPSRPAFYMKSSNAENAELPNGSTIGTEADQSSMNTSQQSVNEVIISELEPR